MKKLFMCLAALLLIVGCEVINPTPDVSSDFRIEYLPEGEISLVMPGKNAAEYLVEFGDGGKQTYKSNEQIYYVYADNGNYSISVTAYSDNKKKSSVSTNRARITSCAGTFGIYINKDFQHPYLEVLVNNVVSGRITRYFTKTDGIHCSTPDVLRTKLAPGSHSYLVRYPSGTRAAQGSFKISNKGCFLLQLN